MATKPKALAAGADAIYARYSSDLQNPRSVADQVADLKDAIGRRIGGRFDDAFVFSDAEVSGSIWERPGLQALLRAVKDGRVRRIFVEDVPRISRDRGDASKLEKMLRFHNIPLVSVSDGFELDGSSGASLTFGFKALLSDQYLQDLGSKTRRGLRGNAREGKTTGGRIYGYRPDAENRVQVVPVEAEIVCRVFRLYAEGSGYATIAATLNADRIDPPRTRRRAGGGWMGSCIREMLRNPKYIGQWSFGVREWRRHPDTRRRVAQARDEGDVFRTDRPELAIVDRSLWDLVQARLDEHAKEYKRTNGADRKVLHQRTEYLLTGLLRCGSCGSLMQISGGSPHRYYRCVSNRKRGTCINRLSVKETVARECVLKAISDALWNPDALERIRRQMAEQLGTLSRQLDDELRDRRGRLHRDEDRIRAIIAMQVEGDRSPYVAEMRGLMSVESGCLRR